MLNLLKTLEFWIHDYGSQEFENCGLKCWYEALNMICHAYVFFEVIYVFV